MKRIVVLISGRGSNLQAILRAAAAEGWPACVAGVVSSHAEAPGLEIARAAGLPACVVDHRAHGGREAFDRALGAAIDALEPDVIALAGFMRILGDALVQRHAGRMINVHPSLLPAFPGLQTHRRALEAGCKLAGATVHFVTPALDHGPIIAQAAVPVRAGDDAATLAARVLQQEHRLYPRALRWLVEGDLRLEGGVVSHARGEPQWLFAED